LRLPVLVAFAAARAGGADGDVKEHLTPDRCLPPVTRRLIVERQIAHVVGLILGSIGFGMLMLSALAGQ
jgi:hypothetical protein